MDFPEKRYGRNPTWKRRKIIHIPREEIEAATAEFLAEGGKITYLESHEDNNANRMNPKPQVFGGDGPANDWAPLMPF